MKSQRQAKIIEIITTRNVETQEQLLAALQQEGFRGTQATISRDIKELRIVKELTNMGTYRYTTSGGEISNTFTTRMNTIFRECVVSIDYAQNIIVIRTLPGVIVEASHLDESFENDLLEYPQYTRPEEWHGKKVPEVLLSGHHVNIEKWRREQSLKRTLERRPDLLESANLTKQDKKYLQSLKESDNI